VSCSYISERQPEPNTLKAIARKPEGFTFGLGESIDDGFIEMNQRQLVVAMDLGSLSELRHGLAVHALEPMVLGSRNSQSQATLSLHY
jgi:hypothetical protein